MNYEDRELRARVRELIDERPVPDRPFRPSRTRTPIGLLLSVGILIAVLAIAVGTQLQTRTSVNGSDVNPSAPPTSPTASAPPSAVAAERLELPAAFAGLLSMVSPDARFVGAIARDRSSAVLFRIDRKDPPADLSQLVQVAQVRGQIAQLAWLEDSSALLVQFASSAPPSTGTSKPPRTVFRVAFIDVSGRVTMAPNDVESFTARRAGLSPDGQWISVHGGDCVCSYVRLLARNGVDEMTVVPAPADSSGVGFVGWDKRGLLLYQQVWSDHSTLYAVDVNGTIRYSVPAPSEFGGTGWGIFSQPADRSWQLIGFGRGIGYFNDGYRLLVDGQLRTVPAAVEAGLQYGALASGNELTYRATDGAMRAYDVRTGATRTLALTVPTDASGGLATIGALDRFFVWMQLIHTFVGNLDSGASVELPLQSPPNVDRLDGAHLAEYRDDTVAIIDLAAWMRAFR